MNRNLHAVRIGLQRGWTEFVQSLKSAQDQGFYLFMGVGILVYLWFNRNNEVEGTGLTMPAIAMPSLLGALIAFGVIIGPAYQLAMEREDGTLLRSKAAPRGLVGYVTGQLFFHSLSLVPLLAVVLIPSLLLFDVMQRGLTGWATVLWVLGLGLLSVLPLGIIIGSLVPSVQKVGTWGMLPIGVLVTISGIFYPVQQLWGWVQVVAQIFPVYWLGLGMRSAFLPADAATLEIAGSWRTGWTVAVLAAWAVAGALVAPAVLRRMSRRQSGSAVEEARARATQWVR
jgi:ABC-2 type transport system permease protein